MTFTNAVAALCKATTPDMIIDERPYITTGRNRIVIEMGMLYYVRITEWKDRRNVLSEPYALDVTDVFRKDWRVVKP